MLGSGCDVIFMTLYRLFFIFLVQGCWRIVVDGFTGVVVDKRGVLWRVFLGVKGWFEAVGGAGGIEILNG